MIQFASIRLRLTAWYFLSLAFVLTIFAVGAGFAMRTTTFDAIDDTLRGRIHSVHEFLERESAENEQALLDELREYSMLGLNGGLLQVSNAEGKVLFESAGMARYKVAPLAPSAPDSKPRYATVRFPYMGLRVASQAFEVNHKLYAVQVAQSTHDFEQAINRFQKLILISAPLMLLLATLGGFWLSRRALAPVDRITRDARSISISNLSGRLEVPQTNDELQRLTQTLNEMLERLDHSVGRMVQFTADASHELRAPLTLIHTAAEFSLRRERSTEELVEAMRKIIREASRTARLVDSMLLLARADSGTDGLVFAPVNLTPLLREAHQQALTLAAPKQMNIGLELPAEPVIVQGDAESLGRLLLILLDNSVKYTPAGGRISLQLQVVDGHAMAVVTDSGRGIGAADLPHIFDRFWRADKVRSRDMGGAGLGLSIAKWIVERHGGSLAASSEPDTGSRFQFRLPLSNS